MGRPEAWAALKSTCFSMRLCGIMSRSFAFSCAGRRLPVAPGPLHTNVDVQQLRTKKVEPAAAQAPAHMKGKVGNIKAASTAPRLPCSPKQMAKTAHARTDPEIRQQHKAQGRPAKRPGYTKKPRCPSFAGFQLKPNKSFT